MKMLEYIGESLDRINIQAGKVVEITSKCLINYTKTMATDLSALPIVIINALRKLLLFATRNLRNTLQYLVKVFSSYIEFVDSLEDQLVVICESTNEVIIEKSKLMSFDTFAIIMLLTGSPLTALDVTTSERENHL